ncbi:MAG: deoxyguanosinetriphosphate triphosphohydrolase [Candidatus Omnitrophica bacterium]|nr:deoxyguanosinetriphosphate triphosphohydrolase [Candidatus Omnitrophota bacterium]
MLTRAFIERREHEFLAPYAIKSSESRGRVYPEKEHDFRTAFQRDRDRIIHSTAFRRLEYKTQVFVNHEGDHYRTRLTHTIEMSQIARTIARALRLNEDLTEAIALAHDLGHGPFGHAGQEALSELMKQHGGFEHNAQCLRIVEKLEESYANFHGLNLTFEVREGLRKHARNQIPSLEAEVVDLADSIAYNGHDLDDGLRSGLLNIRMLAKIKLWREVDRYIQKKSPRAPQGIQNKIAIRLLINRMTGDLIEETLRHLRRFAIQKPADLRRAGAKVVRFSKALDADVLELKKFLRKNLYLHPHVIRVTREGQHLIRELFGFYAAHPAQLPAYVKRRAAKEGQWRSLCDYIAGMTDRYAAEEYHRLFLRK